MEIRFDVDELKALKKNLNDELNNLTYFITYGYLPTIDEFLIDSTWNDSAKANFNKYVTPWKEQCTEILSNFNSSVTFLGDYITAYSKINDKYNEEVL